MAAQHATRTKAETPADAMRANGLLRIARAGWRVTAAALEAEHDFQGRENNAVNTDQKNGCRLHKAFSMAKFPKKATVLRTTVLLLLVPKLHLGMAMLGIGERCIRHVRSKESIHFKNLRDYPTHPKTLGEHLCKKRIELSLSLTQLAQLLGIEIYTSTIFKWGKNQNYPTPPNRTRIIEFLGFDPESAKPTGNHS